MSLKMSEETEHGHSFLGPAMFRNILRIPRTQHQIIQYIPLFCLEA